MSLAELETALVDRVLVARLQGEIDMSNAVELGVAVSGRISNDARGLIFDLTEVEYMDSAALHTMFQLRAQLKDRGQQLRLVVPPDATIAHAIEIMEIPRMIGVSASVDAALESIVAAVPAADAAPGPDTERDL